MSSVINRRPTGTPAGGQFALALHDEPEVTLGHPFMYTSSSASPWDCLRSSCCRSGLKSPWCRR